ncbi:hypothetical protein Aduo_018288 [Ancylostoma duodenale]
MDSPVSTSRVQGAKRPCPTFESSRVSQGQAIDEIIGRVRSDVAIPDHLKDLLLYLVDFKEQMGWLIQRNRELERKVDCLLAENEKLRGGSQSIAHVPVTTRASFMSPADLSTSPTQGDSLVVHDSESEIERRRSLVLVGIPEQKSVGVR